MTNLDSLQERRNYLTPKFAQSGLKYNKLNDLLPENHNIHDMEMRKTDKFKVQFANTERLKKSSIIHMQKQLNKADKIK